MTLEELRTKVEEVALRKIGSNIQVLIGAGKKVQIRIRVLPPGKGAFVYKGSSPEAALKAFLAGFVEEFGSID
jgi:hypothetical protein